jgi:hypothetical protein
MKTSQLFFALYTVFLSVPSSLGKADPCELKEVPASLTIYLPAKHGKLERRVVKGKLYDQMPTAPTTYASVVAEKALPLLFQKAQSSFPRGTKLTRFPEIEDDFVMRVSLSKQFLQRGFWNSQEKVLSAVYAIVNTAVEGYGLPENSLRVRFLIEGKPLRNLANMDMRKPLRPRYDIGLRLGHQRFWQQLRHLGSVESAGA